jgi:hypothetical protein
MLAISPALAVALLLPQELPHRDGYPVSTGAPIRYVESSTGLGTPALDGGNTEVELGDVDGDGNVDLVSVGDHGSPFVNTQEHGVMVWFGDGRGAWSVFQLGNFGYGGVALGDVDGDGRMDVGYGIHHAYASVDLGDQLLEVALGDGTGRAWTAWDDGLATHGQTWGMSGTDFADVDNDGDLDVGAISFGCCDGLHVYLNQGDGTWVRSFGFLGGNSNQLFLFADVDNDGNADIVAAHRNGGVLLGDGAGGFTRGDAGLVLGSSGMSGFSAGDADGDGALELCRVNGGGGVELWRYAGAGTWQKLATVGLPAAGPFQATALADMNDDGALDVVAFGRGAGVVFARAPDGSFAPAARFETPSPGTATTLRAGVDADHNGLADIVVVADEGSGFSSRNTLRFLREASVPASLRVSLVQPGANRVLRAGAVCFVDWRSAVPAGAASTVDLELSRSGPAGPFVPLAAGLPDNGRWQWRVPAEISEDCRLRITVMSGAQSARALSARFAIR